MRKLIDWWRNLEKVNGMRIIRNRVIPFSGYKAINLFGILFAKPKAKIDEMTINHESIHSKQYKEVTLVLAIPLLALSYSVSWWWIILIPFTFYIWYVVEFLIRWAITRNWDDAYRNIGFEKEAYVWQGMPDERKRFGFLKYMI